METNKSYILKPKAKKKAVKFLLTPRPQRDPLAADFEAPQHVLVPKDGADIQEICEKLSDFDPTVFASKQQTKTGMLERAHNADGITLDHEVLEAMSKDFDFDDPNNILDDDFVVQAGGFIEEEGEELVDIDDLFEDESDAEPEELTGESRNGKDREILNPGAQRSEGLQQIDEHFDRLYENEYADDTEIGALDLNEVKGEELLTNIDQIRQLKNEVKTVRKRNHGDNYEPEIVSDHHKNAIIGDDFGAEDEDLVEVEVQRRENKVDCESILTYNSNLYNHPKLITEPRKRSSSQSNSIQMEADDSDARSRSGKGQSVASSRATVLSKLSIRPTCETIEEKKARKKALKAYRSERRQERKQNQQIFKSERAQVVKQQRTNMPALKLA